MAVIDLPADPTIPVIAKMTVGRHDYRMVVDTAAGNLFFHLPIAERDLAPVPMDTTSSAIPKELQADPGVRSFRVKKFTVDGWTVRPKHAAYAVDLGPMANEYGIDGLLGVPYLAQLSWHWDNRSRQLRGYPYKSKVIADLRSHLHCEQLLQVDGVPGIALTVGKEQALFAIDTSQVIASGNIHPTIRRALSAHDAIRATGTRNPPAIAAGPAQSPTHFAQLRNVSLGPTRLDGLVLGETESTSRLGRGLLEKFNEVLMDFGGNQICFPSVAEVAPDDLSGYLAE
ncbi:hypothetical protein GCM10007235_05630 [Pseudoxanthomonas indica]|nr:hypothetical protein GCM10007235_05630 [Pseudoxanthomonas indica]